MMRMTYTSLCNCMKMLTWACYEAFVTVAERKATTTTTKMVPRQHSDDPTTHRDVGVKKCGSAEHAKDGGVIPDSGCPTRRR